MQTFFEKNSYFLYIFLFCTKIGRYERPICVFSQKGCRRISVRLDLGIYRTLVIDRSLIENGNVSVYDTLEREGGNIEVAYLLNSRAVAHVLLVDLNYDASVRNAVEFISVAIRGIALVKCDLHLHKQNTAVDISLLLVGGKISYVSFVLNVEERFDEFLEVYSTDVVALVVLSVIEFTKAYGGII